MSDNPNLCEDAHFVNTQDNVFIDTSNPLPGYSYIPRFLFRLRLDPAITGMIMFILSFHPNWLQYLDGLIDYFESLPELPKRENQEELLKILESKYQRFIGGAK